MHVAAFSRLKFDVGLRNTCCMPKQLLVYLKPWLQVSVDDVMGGS